MRKNNVRLFLFFVVLFGGVDARALELTRPECLVPARQGGGMYLTCRLASDSLFKSNLIDRPMQVKYRPGGIGAVAYNHVVGVRNADPELIVAASSGSALNIATGKFGKYDAADVRWLAALGTDYGMIAVRQDAPWESLEALIKDLTAGAARIVIGGGGSIGSQDWIKIALIAKSAGIDPHQLRFIAYEGGGEALRALHDGYIQVFSGDVSEIYSHLDTDAIRVIAVLAAERLPGRMAALPTAKEQGYDVEWPIWRGFYMGPQVSDDAYNWWVNTFRSLAKTPEFQRERDNMGLHPFSLIGREFNDYVRRAVEKQRLVAAELGLIP